MRLKPIIDSKLIAAAQALLQPARSVVITCHMTPDGDAMGSSLGLAWTLANMGKNVKVVTPDTPPAYLDFLPGRENIYIASRQNDGGRAILAEADLVFCLDYNGLKRVDRLAPAIEAAAAPRIMIDHHLDPDLPADVVISHPESSSTCALLYHFLRQMWLTEYITPEAATCIYTGMLTDTGNFTYNSNSPDLYLIIAELLDNGLDKDYVYKKAWNTKTESGVRVFGYAECHKMTLMAEHKAALITLAKSELEEFGYKKGDTEGLVNVPLSIQGVVYSIFLREDEPDYVKVSMRSVGDFPVDKICAEQFGGGGHKNAAGGDFHGTLSQAIDRVLDVMPLYDSLLELGEEKSPL